MAINLTASFAPRSDEASFNYDRMVIWSSIFGGHGGGGGGGSQANEGVGNGADAPPPGQDYNFNDAPGTGPGSPGAQGGNGYMPAGLVGVDLSPLLS